MIFEIQSQKGTEMAEAGSKEELMFYISRAHKEKFGQLIGPYRIKVITEDQIHFYKQNGVVLQNAYRQ